MAHPLITTWLGSPHRLELFQAQGGVPPWALFLCKQKTVCESSLGGAQMKIISLLFSTWCKQVQLHSTVCAALGMCGCTATALLNSRPMHPWVYVVFFFAVLGSKSFMQFLAAWGVPQGLLVLLVSAVCTQNPHSLSQHLSLSVQNLGMPMSKPRTQPPACSRIRPRATRSAP